jgi:hypothetical protein
MQMIFTRCHWKLGGEKKKIILEFCVRKYSENVEQLFENMSVGENLTAGFKIQLRNSLPHTQTKHAATEVKAQNVQSS